MDNKQAEKIAGAAVRFVDSVEKLACAFSTQQQSNEAHWRVMLWLKRMLDEENLTATQTSEAKWQLRAALEEWLYSQGGFGPSRSPNGYFVKDGRAYPLPDGCSGVRVLGDGTVAFSRDERPKAEIERICGPCSKGQHGKCNKADCTCEI